MALYTNTMERLVTLPDYTMMIPGVPVEVADDVVSNATFQAMLEAELVVAGDKKPEAAKPEQTAAAPRPAPATTTAAPAPTATATKAS